MQHSALQQVAQCTARCALVSARAKERPDLAACFRVHLSDRHCASLLIRYDCVTCVGCHEGCCHFVSACARAIGRDAMIELSL